MRKIFIITLNTSLLLLIINFLIIFFPQKLINEKYIGKNLINYFGFLYHVYYNETYNRDNVTLLDVNKDPINRIVENGVQTKNKTHEFDVIIYAIGFDAMTGALLAMDIQGKSEVSLRDKWSDGPRTYLGLTSAGFPNMFTITGPGSPSVLSNMMTSIEQHVGWIAECIEHMEANSYNTIEPDEESENDWMDHIEEIASDTLRYSCNSWYVGANIPGKRRIFMPYAGGVDKYAEKCDEIVAAGYEGFRFG